MLIIGLTGSIGMGKTTAGRTFRRLGIPVHDADAAVHEMFAKGGSLVTPIERAFPGTTRLGMVDRQLLGQRVFGDDEALKTLEALVHPAVRRHEREFLARCARRRVAAVVLDIPLLFETGGDRRCDLVVVVWAPSFVQSQRVLKRPGMTRDKLRAIRQRQTPDAEKRRRAHFLIPTGLGRNVSFDRIRHLLYAISTLRGCHWPPVPAGRRRTS